MTRSTLVLTRLSVLLVLALSVVAGCESDRLPTGPAPDLKPSLSVIGGDVQQGPPGEMLPQPIVVRVTDFPAGAHARPIPGIVVNWVVTDGGGSPYVAATQTDFRGETRNWWTLGPKAGTQTLEVRAVNPTTGEQIVFATVKAKAIRPVQWRILSDAPLGYAYGDVWGSASSGQIYAPGPRDGQIVDFDGSAWRVLPTGTSNGINAVFGFSDTDVYAVGGNFAGSVSVLRFDGSGWAQMPGVPQDAFVTDIWGASPTDLFATRVETTVMRYDGSTWRVMETPATGRLESIWGFGPADVYAVGRAGNVLHFDGAAWTKMASGTEIGLNDIWGSGPSDVFAVGGGGTIIHYDGAAWNRMESGTTEHIFAVWGTSPTDVMAVGANGIVLRYDGSRWQRLESGTTRHLLGVWGNSPTNYYAVGGVFGFASYGSVVLRYSP